MFRRAILVAAAAAVAAGTMLPASAAPKTQVLYFGNAGACGAESPSYVLAASPVGSPCSSTFVAAQGNGLTAPQSFVETKAVSRRLDVSRPVTGTLYFKAGILNGVPSFPGYLDATLTIKAGSTKVGDVAITGAMTPAGPLKKDFSLKLPATLAKSTAVKWNATVTYNTYAGGGVVTVSYDPASVLNLPLK
jgi:hypothetical protein